MSDVKEWMAKHAELEIKNAKLTWKLLRVMSALETIATSGSMCYGCQAELCHQCIARRALAAERPEYDLHLHWNNLSDKDGLMPADDE